MQGRSRAIFFLFSPAASSPWLITSDEIAGHYRSALDYVPAPES